MISPPHLIALARDLATLDPRRPRQASLRRAVSTAYYAVFHMLIQGAVGVQLGFGPTQTHREIGWAAARWFNHGQMAGTCRFFVGPVVPGKLRSALPPAGAAVVALSAELQNVARAFVDLQQARHDADYDMSKWFTRQDALLLVERAEQAFADWEAAATDPFRPVFMLMLLTGESVIRDR